MRPVVSLLALVFLASGCSDADAPAVVTDDPVTVADGDAAPDASMDIADADPASGLDGPDEISAADAGGEVGAVSAAAAGEDAGAVEVTRAGEGRAATQTMSVSVEGDAYTETLRLAAFPDFPVPFSTYLREGITVEQPGSGDALSIEVNDMARILVTVPYESVDAALTRIRGAIADPQPLDGAEAWVRGGFFYRDGDTVGTVRVGEHDGTTFVVEETYPAEMGDGFAPTAKTLFDEWRWADGSTL